MGFYRSFIVVREKFLLEMRVHKRQESPIVSAERFRIDRLSMFDYYLSRRVSLLIRVFPFQIVSVELFFTRPSSSDDGRTFQNVARERVLRLGDNVPGSFYARFLSEENGSVIEFRVRRYVSRNISDRHW